MKRSQKPARKEFTRENWLSESARRDWQPRIQAIRTAYEQLERLSVAEGVRRANLTMVQPTALPDFARRVQKLGLEALPYENVAPTKGYSNVAGAVGEGEPFTLRVVVARAADGVALVDAWRAGDQIAIGELLGFPACCSRAFQRVWVEGGRTDSTWWMANEGACPREDASYGSTTVGGSTYSNILGRWLSLRFVPHLPCSFDCDGTAVFGASLEEVARRAGFEREMDRLHEFLSLPAIWCAEGSTAQIVYGDLLALEVSSDTTPARRIVEHVGGERVLPYRAAQRPHDAVVQTMAAATVNGVGSHGTRAPHDTVRQPPTRGYPTAYGASGNGAGNGVLGRGPVRGGAVPRAAVRDTSIDLASSHASPAIQAEHDLYTANGFDSAASMQACHGPIVEHVATLLRGVESPSILDLGCGNGVLLRSIAERCDRARLFGVELERARLEQFGSVLPEHAHRAFLGNLLELPSPWLLEEDFDAVLLMPGRLVEAGPDRSQALLERLSATRNLVVYAYGYWLDEPYGDLRTLTESAGLEPQFTDLKARVGPARASLQSAPGRGAY